MLSFTGGASQTVLWAGGPLRLESGDNCARMDGLESGFATNCPNEDIATLENP